MILNHFFKYIQRNDKGFNSKLSPSVAYRLGGMGGQYPGAPEPKGPPRERQEKKRKRRIEKEKKEKEEEKRENKPFQIPGRGPTRYIPMSLSRA